MYLLPSVRVKVFLVKKSKRLDNMTAVEESKQIRHLKHGRRDLHDENTLEGHHDYDGNLDLPKKQRTSRWGPPVAIQVSSFYQDPRQEMIASLKLRQQQMDALIKQFVASENKMRATNLAKESTESKSLVGKFLAEHQVIKSKFALESEALEDTRERFRSSWKIVHDRWRSLRRDVELFSATKDIGIDIGAATFVRNILVKLKADAEQSGTPPFSLTANNLGSDKVQLTVSLKAAIPLCNVCLSISHRNGHYIAISDQAASDVYLDEGIWSEEGDSISFELLKRNYRSGGVVVVHVIGSSTEDYFCELAKVSSKTSADFVLGTL